MDAVIERGRKTLAYINGEWLVKLGTLILDTTDPHTAAEWWRTSGEALEDARADVSAVWAASIR